MITFDLRGQKEVMIVKMALKNVCDEAGADTIDVKSCLKSDFDLRKMDTMTLRYAYQDIRIRK